MVRMVTVAVMVVLLAGCATGVRRVERATDPIGALGAVAGAVLSGDFVGVAAWGAGRLIEAAGAVREHARYEPAPAGVPVLDVPNPRGLPSEHAPDYTVQPAVLIATP